MPRADVESLSQDRSAGQTGSERTNAMAITVSECSVIRSNARSSSCPLNSKANIRRTYAKQRIACAHDARRALKHRCDRGQPFKRQEQSMPQSPGDEIPARAMPCAGEEKHEPQVPNRRPCAEAIAAERDVDVVAKPRRQGHVPAPPEVLYRGRG